MTTAIEDNQLTLELQELYSIAKEWLKDLTALNASLGVRHRVFRNSISKTSTEDNYFIAEVGDAVATIDARYAKMKLDINAYLDELSPLIDKSNGVYELQLIEHHVLLEHKINALFYAYIDSKETINKFLQT